MKSSHWDVLLDSAAARDFDRLDGMIQKRIATVAKSTAENS